MTDFKSTTPGTASILSNELEKKIEEVNASMVEARVAAEKSQLNKNTLDGEIRDLEVKKESLEGEVPRLKAEIDALVVLKDSLKVEITDLNSELNSIRG